jgi:hypothetical protein
LFYADYWRARASAAPDGQLSIKPAADTKPVVVNH